MSIRPIDLQVTIQRSVEVGRIGENNVRQDANAQAFPDIVKKEIDLDDRQIKDLDKSEQDKITRDKKGNSGGYSGQKRNKNKQDEDEDAKDAPKQRGMFDVSV
ncbi:MAG: hypothetical protein FWE29_04150 [Defluviitaleaceae bacterium]|nr:hypothetical protein [Defluviitaleaceae bacterium]